MQANHFYLLRSVQGTPYLLPYGEGIGHRLHGIQLNHTGVLLWNALCRGADENGLLAVLADAYKADKRDYPQLRQDISTFLSQLQALGVYTASSQSKLYPACFSIGGLQIAYDGPKELLFPALHDFSCSQPPCFDQIWTVKKFAAPGNDRNGAAILSSPDVEICRTRDAWILNFPCFTFLQCCRISTDCRQAVFYVPEIYSSSVLAQELFHAARFAFLLAAQAAGLFALHSASLVYREKAWLFSAPSGVGKSTHVSLWHTQFGTPILNGDLNLLGIKDSRPYVAGIPWCGTSGISTVKEYPLGGIVLLKRAAENHVLKLSASKKQLLVTQRLISPAWTAAQFDACLNFAGQLVDLNVPILQLFCTKDPQAAKIMKHTIDKILNEP